MATTTTNYNLNKPTPGGDTDTWGDLLNTSMDLIDTQMKANADAVAGLGDPVTVAHGGTGATTESGARSALGLGTAATQSDSKYPHRANNLNDLNDKGAARVNIGANNASNLTTGTLPDARLTSNIMRGGNNLSDVANTATARENLGAHDASNLTSGTVPDARMVTTPVTSHPVSPATSGSINYIKIARVVTLTWTSMNVTADTVHTITSKLPSGIRPTSILRNVSSNFVGNTQEIRLFEDGTIRFNHLDSSGNATSMTIIFGGSISYIV